MISNVPVPSSLISASKNFKSLSSVCSVRYLSLLFVKDTLLPFLVEAVDGLGAALGSSTTGGTTSFLAVSSKGLTTPVTGSVDTGAAAALVGFVESSSLGSDNGSTFANSSSRGINFISAGGIFDSVASILASSSKSSSSKASLGMSSSTG